MSFKSDKQRKKVMMELNLNSQLGKLEKSLPRLKIDNKDRLKELHDKFIDLLKIGNIEEANKLQDEIRKLKYDTSRLSGEIIFKVRVHSIIGGERIVTYKLRPNKKFGLGFDYWRDGKKITGSNQYLMSSSFEEAKKQLLEVGEYEFSREEIKE